jgi:hypothetical protein
MIQHLSIIFLFQSHSILYKTNSNNKFRVEPLRATIPLGCIQMLHWKLSSKSCCQRTKRRARTQPKQTRIFTSAQLATTLCTLGTVMRAIGILLN